MRACVQLKVTLAGIEIEVAPKPEGLPNVPTAKVLSQIPTAAFTGSVNSRDKMVLQLLQKGKDANGQADFLQACACFEAAYALSMRGGMLVSAANMRLKLGDATGAVAQARRTYQRGAPTQAEEPASPRCAALEAPRPLFICPCHISLSRTCPRVHSVPRAVARPDTVGPAAVERVAAGDRTAEACGGGA